MLFVLTENTVDGKQSFYIISKSLCEIDESIKRALQASVPLFVILRTHKGRIRMGEVGGGETEQPLSQQPPANLCYHSIAKSIRSILYYGFSG